MSEILRGKTGGGAAGGRPGPGGQPACNKYSTVQYTVQRDAWINFFWFMTGCLQKNEDCLHSMEQILVARVTLLLSGTKRYHIQDQISPYY
jgi:hypothetical protein